jgi:hypothetical protein
VALEITEVWKQVTPELQAELLEMWQRNNALHNPALAATRAGQAVCVGRDEAGRIVAVGTAVTRVLPRLRQPMYYYRQFFAEEFRGQKQAVPFFARAKDILEAYNASLDAPESLGLLLELENPQLATRYNMAQGPMTTFIGYSPRGLQLRVAYFKDAALLPPRDLPRREGAPPNRRVPAM